MAIHVVEGLSQLLLGLSMWLHHNRLKVDREAVSIDTLQSQHAQEGRSQCCYFYSTGAIFLGEGQI